MQQIGWMAGLLECAMDKIITQVWMSTYEKVGTMYTVRRASCLSKDGENELQVYYVAFGAESPSVEDLLGSVPLGEARSVTLIGNRCKETVSMLKGQGFEEEWETQVYIKEVGRSLPPDPDFCHREGVRLADVTEVQLGAANSFCEDLYISESSVVDPSFVTKLLLYEDICIGKIQLVLCPPFGVFCTLVAVREDQRRRGYFALMMSAAESLTREQDLSHLALFSGSYANSIGLYARRDYSGVGTYTIMKRAGDTNNAEPS